MLRSIVYEPPGEPSMFDLWEAGAVAALAPPLAVRCAAYRRRIVGLLEPYRRPGSRLVSVGAGNGFAEAALAEAGWDVVATDPAESALRHCRAKGLATLRFALLVDPAPGVFEAVYCDGVMGHLWSPAGGCEPVWRGLAALGSGGTIAVVSNDLADGARGAQFAVRSDPAARFYRPPPGVFAGEAARSGLWKVVSQSSYDYVRGGTPRRREIVVARLLVNERIETEDRA
jgi:hypothetical protein